MKKIKAILRWLIVYLLLIPAQLLSILFPLAWVMRGLGRKNPLWIVMDDTRFDNSRESGLAADYEVYVRDRNKFKETFLIALEWHVKRNRVWNLLELFKVPTPSGVGNNRSENIEYIIDKLYKNDENKTKVRQDTNYIAKAGIKYIPKREGEDIWQVNQGDEFSIKTSILGTALIFFDINGWYSFRFSFCNIVNYGFWKGYLNIYMGTDVRYAFAIKHIKIKEWK